MALYKELAKLPVDKALKLCKKAIYDSNPDNRLDAFAALATNLSHIPVARELFKKIQHDPCDYVRGSSLAHLTRGSGGDRGVLLKLINDMTTDPSSFVRYTIVNHQLVRYKALSSLLNDELWTITGTASYRLQKPDPNYPGYFLF